MRNLMVYRKLNCVQKIIIFLLYNIILCEKKVNDKTTSKLFIQKLRLKEKNDYKKIVHILNYIQAQDTQPFFMFQYIRTLRVNYYFNGDKMSILEKLQAEKKYRLPNAKMANHLTHSEITFLTKKAFTSNCAIATNLFLI